MKCPHCGAILTVGGTRQGPVGTQTEIEAHAWAMHEDVKCWRCGRVVRAPMQKPSDRPKLHRGGTDGGLFRKPLNAMEYYARTGNLKEAYRKIKGRKVDEGL